jgi:hypothetical protein
MCTGNREIDTRIDIALVLPTFIVSRTDSLGQTYILGF